MTPQYQWFYNGAPIEDTNTQSITASVAGIYSVKVTDLTTTCSAMSASVTIKVGPSFSLALFQCCNSRSDDVVSLTTAVKNSGEDAAPAVAVTVDIPKWLTFVGGEPSTWTFTQSGSTVTARYNQPLLAGQIEAFTIDAKVNGKPGQKEMYYCNHERYIWIENSKMYLINTLLKRFCLGVRFITSKRCAI